MLLLFLEWLSFLGWKVPTVFHYCSTRMALAALTAFVSTLLLGKPLIRKLYQWKIGDRVRSEECPLLGELHRNKNDTPTMGGGLMIFALLISLILWMDLRNVFTLVLFITTVSMAALGGWDDYLKLRYKNKVGIRGKKKLLLQAGLALFVVSYLLWTPLTEALHHGQWFSPPIARSEGVPITMREYAARLYVPFCKTPWVFTSSLKVLLIGAFMVFVITGASNAVNLTDGLDGLATGTVMMVAGAFSLIAFVSNHVDLARYLHILYIEGSGEIAVYLAALFGACLGFLWYNSHPAQVFMGDTGSLTLGAILGVSAALLKREFLLGMVGGVFVIETLSVMLQVGSYKWQRKRLFLCAPLHHHFEYKGWTETKIVTRFWIITLILSLVGLVSLKFQ